MGINDHGSLSTYTNHRCRCARCREAQAAAQRDARRRRAVRFAADPSLAEHGTNLAYVEWGCRCQPCTEAHTAVKAAWRATRRAS